MSQLWCWKVGGASVGSRDGDEVSCFRGMIAGFADRSVECVEGRAEVGGRLGWVLIGGGSMVLEVD